MASFAVLASRCGWGVADRTGHVATCSHAAPLTHGDRQVKAVGRERNGLAVVRLDVRRRGFDVDRIDRRNAMVQEDMFCRRARARTEVQNAPWLPIVRRREHLIDNLLLKHAVAFPSGIP